MRKLILCLVIIAVASGCVGDSTSEEPQPDTPDESPQSSDEVEDQQDNNTVRYTDSGFQPESLTIEQGETVTWVDESSSPMWVASDRHPSHTNYDGTSLSQHCGDEEAFDQCETGEEFSFTFDQTGSWEYHNHRNDGHGGEIVVE